MEKAIAGQAVNVLEALTWFTFDGMGDMLFSKSFGMLDSRGWHDIIARVKHGLYLLGPLSPVPWLMCMGLRFGPNVSILHDWRELNAWCQAEMTARLASSDGNASDLAYYMMERKHKSNKTNHEAFMSGDSLLAIVVGRFVGFLLLKLLIEMLIIPS
jgi:hypothetical protein